MINWFKKFLTRKPANLEQAIAALDKELPVEDKNLMEGMDEDEFVAVSHHSVGRWIRNNWGLWDESSKLYKWFKSRGIWHADDMSGIILTSYYRTANNLPIELKTQIGWYVKYWQEQRRNQDGSGRS